MSSLLVVGGAHVVDGARFALGEDQPLGGGVVDHVGPVADVLPVAVERDGQPVDQVGHEQRDDLLGVVVGPEVVGRSGHEDGEVVGHAVGAGQQVGAGLGRRVRRVGEQAVGLDERARLLDRAVDLVGRDVQHPVDLEPARSLEHDARSGDVGAQELRGAVDRAVDVRLGSEVDDGVVAVHRLTHGITVTDVALDEGVAIVVGDVGQRREVARVGQGVEVGDPDVVGHPERVADEVGADEARSAGDEDSHGRSLQQCRSSRGASKFVAHAEPASS